MDIVQIITTIIGYVATIVLFIKGLFDKKKTKDTIENASTTMSELDESVTKLQILSQVNDYCAEAEQIIGSGNGPLKTLYVTCKVESVANLKGVTITQEEITEAIASSLKSPQAKASEVNTNDN